MIKCIFMRKKLYELLDDSLSEQEEINIKKHLDSCHACRVKFVSMQEIIKMAENKNIPHPSEDFWHKFKVELDDKLNEQLVTPFQMKPSLRSILRPAIVVPLASVFILILSLSLYLQNKTIYISSSDQELVEEAALIEELSPESNIFNGDEEYYTDFEA